MMVEEKVEEVVTTKTIVSSGGCLSLNMTKELRLLGLKKGDTVLVTVQRV